jgi:hypothetical protein
VAQGDPPAREKSLEGIAVMERERGDPLAARPRVTTFVGADLRALQAWARRAVTAASTEELFR